MTNNTIDNLELRRQFNSQVKPRYKQTHTPQCQKCMRFHPWGNSIMEVHHKKALIDGGSNEESNLVTLCYECHAEWHKRECQDISFDEWMRKVPLWVYAAIGLSEDKELKKEMLTKIDEMWPYVQEARMLSEPWSPEHKQYLLKNKSNWIDW